MSKKRKTQTVARDWGIWEAATPLPISPEKEAAIKAACSQEEWDEYVKYRNSSKVYINNIYQVSMTDITDSDNAPWIWLSIKRRDKKVIHDWRHLQRIKNELVGYDREAIEIYPPDSQLVDEANQFHLWVMPAGMVSPVGFRTGRRVGGSEEAAMIGARQREFA